MENIHHATLYSRLYELAQQDAEGLLTVQEYNTRIISEVLMYLEHIEYH